MFDIESKNLMFDYGLGKDVFDEGRQVGKSEINETIKRVCFESLGLGEKPTARDVKRALKKDSALELFSIIEEVLDLKISTGFAENEFFNMFIETRNIADGDAPEFVVNQETYLNVAKVTGANHDNITQKLAEGVPFTVPTSVYVVKVGTDIRLFLTGQKDWAEWIDAAAKAIVRELMAEAYGELMSASTNIPATAQFNKTGALAAATKDTFDTLIEDVGAVNDSDVIIMGTKTALKKLNGLADVDWIADSQKEAYASTGIMGRYEGTVLVEIPQRFANGTTATKLVDNTKLLILPVVDDNKFLKMVDYGETTLEVTEVGATMNDQQTYEIQRRMGIAAILTRYFGTWTITA